MDFLTLPTDSTYKLAAVGGMVLLLGSMWVATTQLNELSLEVATRQANSEILALKVEDLSRDVDVLDRRANPSKDEALAMKAKIQALRDKRLEQRLETQITSAKSANFRQLWNMLKVFLFLGFILMAWGFFCWHRKIQIPQDQLIQEQVAVLKRQRLAEARAQKKLEENQA